jgi:hypothetical protein
MIDTILNIIQDYRRSQNLPVPTSIYGSTDPDEVQLLNLVYEVCEELRAARCWPQCKRRHTFYVEANRSIYKLPADYYSPILDSHWNQSEDIKLFGPTTDARFNWLLHSGTSSYIDYSYRVFGWDENTATTLGQFEINPDTASPARWKPYTAYSTGTYISVPSGVVYRCSSGGTTAGNEPGGASGFTDGTCTWQRALGDWAASTAYSLTDVVYNNGYGYLCTNAGTSGATGPTGTDLSQTDGTCVWDWVFTLPSENIPLSFDYITRNLFLPTHYALTKAYAENALVNVAGNVYKCSGAITASDTVPTGTGTGIIDDDGTWDFYSTPYERVLADTDLCIFDYDLVKLGLKAFDREAKAGDWAQAEEKFRAKIESAVARMEGCSIGSLAGPVGTEGYRTESKSWSI